MRFINDADIGAQKMRRWKGLIEEEDWEEDEDYEEDEDEEW